MVNRFRHLIKLINSVENCIIKCEKWAIAFVIGDLHRLIKRLINENWNLLILLCIVYSYTDLTMRSKPKLI